MANISLISNTRFSLFISRRLFAQTGATSRQVFVQWSSPLARLRLLNSLGVFTQTGATRPIFVLHLLAQTRENQMAFSLRQELLRACFYFELYTSAPTHNSLRVFAQTGATRPIFVLHLLTQTKEYQMAFRSDRSYFACVLF